MFKRRILARWLVCLLLMLPSATRKPTLAQERNVNLDELEATARAERIQTRTPGVAIAVVKGKRIVFAKGFGVSNVETGAPVTPDTIFRVGPITKIFTAATLVSLSTEGKIKLDDPVGKYVKGLGPKLSRVTAHQLLSHTGGIREEHQTYGAYDQTALENTVRSWKDEYCFDEPGKIYSLSNPGYILAGLLIQKVSGKYFADVIDERLFQPLDMNRSTFRLSLVMTYPFSQSYRGFGEDEPALVRPFAVDAVGWPSGSMFSSVNDLARFTVAFMDGGKLDGKQVLSAPVIEKLSSPYVSFPDNLQEQQSGYGLNIENYRGVRLLSNSGSWAGFTSLIWMIPEHDLAIIILANKSAAFFNATAHKALELMLPLPAQDGPAPAAPLPLSATEIRDYIGTYVNDNSMEIFSKDGKLFLKDRGMEWSILKIGANRFSATTLNGNQSQTFTLVSGKNGKIEYLHRAGRALKKIQDKN